MSVVVAEGVVVIDADGKGVPKKVAEDIENNPGPLASAGQGVGRQIFGGIISAYAAIGGTQAVLGYFTDAITGASDLSETLSKSEVIFGSNARQIEAWGDTAATTVGMSKEAAISAAASFGDMFTQIGFTDDAAAEMSKTVVQAAADLGSFSNLDTADVTDRISAAFRGEYDSLQAVIPNINAARVESEALAMTGKTVASELTAQEKAAAVLAIVQTDGARAMGDFARTSDGAANAAKIATASLEDQQAKLGGVLLPMWSNFLSFVNTSIVPAFSTLVTWISENSDVLGGLAMAIGAAAGVFVGLKLAVALYNGVSAIFKAYQIASAAATGGLTVAQWALNAAMNANPIGIIITLISLLVGAIVWVATQTTFFQDAWAWMTEAIGTAWEWLWNTVLEPIFSAIGAVFTWIYENIIMPIVTGIMIQVGIWAAIFEWLWNTILSPIFEAIGAVFTWIYENIIMPIVTGIMIQIGIWGAIFEWLWNTILSPVFNAIGEIFNWIWQNVISPIVSYIQLAIQAAGLVFQWLYSSIIQPVFNAVGTAFNWVWNTIIQPVTNFISGAITNVGNTIRSVFGGISDFIGSAFNAVLGVVRGPVNAIIGLINGVIDGLNSISVDIPDWVPIVGGQHFGLSIAKIPMLATGGNVWREGSAIVGERGPELLNLPAGASVHPLTASQRANPLGESGDAPLVGRDLNIYEAEDPLGSAGRVAAELRKFRKK